MDKGLGLIEQMAISIVLAVVALGSYFVHWALTQKKIAEQKAITEAQKRMEAELKYEVDRMSINKLVDESNKRHGR